MKYRILYAVTLRVYWTLFRIVKYGWRDFYHRGHINWFSRFIEMYDILDDIYSFLKYVFGLYDFIGENRWAKLKLLREANKPA